MKKLILPILVVVSLLVTTMSCQKESNDINPSVHKGAAREEIDIDAVTVVGYRNNDFSSYLTLYYGNEYQITSSPYDGFLNEQGSDEAIENVSPATKLRFLRYLNTKFAEVGHPGFNAHEMNILSNLTIKQIFQVYSIYQTAINVGTVANNIEFHGDDDNGFANAFRHMYLAFTLAKSIGAGVTQQLLNAHEENPSPAVSTQMDTKNNALGLDIFNRPNVYGIGSLNFQDFLNLAKGGYVWTIQNGQCVKVPYVSQSGSKGPQT